MSLGVLNNISAIYAQNDLTATQASLQTTLQQLSSGSRINSGADDAAGLSIANGLAANSAALTQSSENATDGVGLLQVADGALSQVTSLLNRAVTLATEAGNGTLDSSQLSAAQQEYGDILSEINTIGSSTVFNGNNVFSSTGTNIFTSDGTATGTTNYNVTVGTLNTTSGVGVTAPNSATGASGLVSTPIETAVNSGGSTYAAATADAYTFTDGGADTDTIAGSATSPLAVEVGTTVYNIAIPTAGETLDQLTTELQTDLGSSVASVTDAGGVITLTGNTGTSNAVTIINGGDLYDATVPGAVTLAQTSSVANAVPYAPASSETFQLNAANASDTFTDNNLAIDVNGTATKVIFTYGGAGTTETQADLITDIGTALAASGEGAAGGVVAGAGGTAPALSDIVITASVTTPNFSFTGSVNDILTPAVAGAATAGVSLNGTDLNTNSDAATALTDIYTAIGDIAYQRGAVGANINTLNAVSNVETTQNVNVSSAENSITATDYGAATSNLSKYEILSQTGISALAQANSVQQEVLKLLQ